MSRLNELIAELCPDGAEYKHFDEVCTLKARVGWQRLTKKEHLSTGDYLLVTGTDFTEAHSIDYSTCVFVEQERYDMDENIQLRNGDVLITKDGTLGKVAYVDCLPKPATLNGGVFVVRTKDECLAQKYIMHFLLSYGFSSAVESQHTGSTIKHLTQAIFSRIKIPVPPIEIQREIVHILDSFQELNDALTVEIEAREQQLQHVRSACFERYFGDPTSSELAKTGVRLGELYTVSSSKRIYQSEQVAGGIPFLRVADLISRIDGEDVVPELYISEAKYDEMQAAGYVPKPDDILVTARGTLGRYYFVRDDDRFYFQDGMITWLRQRDESPSRHFFEALFSDARFLEKLISNCGQGTVKYLSIKGLAGTMVPIPDRDLMAKFDNEMEELQSLVYLLESIKNERGARRKQFAYYRDKLLDLPEKVTTNG